MPGKTAALPFLIILLGFAGGITLYARSARQAPAADQSLSEEERTRLLAKGKGIFVERCARCHNERADKSHTRVLTNARFGQVISTSAWCRRANLRDRS